MCTKQSCMHDDVIYKLSWGFSLRFELWSTYRFLWRGSKNRIEEWTATYISQFNFDGCHFGLTSVDFPIRTSIFLCDGNWNLPSMCFKLLHDLNFESVGMDMNKNLVTEVLQWHHPFLRSMEAWKHPRQMSPSYTDEGCIAYGILSTLPLPLN